MDPPSLLLADNGKGAAAPGMALLQKVCQIGARASPLFLLVFRLKAMARAHNNGALAGHFAPMWCQSRLLLRRGAAAGALARPSGTRRFGNRAFRHLPKPI